MRWLLAGLLSLPVAGAPADVAAAVARWSAAAPHLFARSAGTSTEGRDLPLLIATMRPGAPEEQIRVLVLAQQHGDEPAPARAAVRWMESAAGRNAPFDRVAVLLMPTVNPDGAARGRRANSREVDLNRSWLLRDQAENRAVMRVFDAWQPHLVIDLHQFGMRRAGPREADWIEWYPTGDRALDGLAESLARGIVAGEQRVGQPIRLTRTPAGYATSLCHRYFAARHRAVALLYEVGGDDGEPQARSLERLIDHLAREADRLKPRLDAVRGVREWRPRGLLIRADAPGGAGRPPALPVRRPLEAMVAGYLLVMLCRAKFRAERDEI